MARNNLDDRLDDRYKIVEEKLADASPLVVASIKSGIIFVAENPTAILKKTAEIYDRIGWGAVGRYAEFDPLRKEIIYLADIMGYNYAREDVRVEQLATHLAEQLQIEFSNFKRRPPVVEIILAEVNSKSDKIFKISFDGDIQSHFPYAAIGCNADKIIENLKTTLGNRQITELSKGEAILLIKEAILSSKKEKDQNEEVRFEISFLNRKKTGRCFERIK